MATVYLIHFNRPLGSKRHAARHYIGFSQNLLQRLLQHRRGWGTAKIMQAVKRKRIGWEVAFVWDDVDRSFERRLKRAGHYDRHCPTCRELRAPQQTTVIQRFVPGANCAPGDMPY